MIKSRVVPVLLAAGLLLPLTGCVGGTASGSDASGTPTAIATSPSSSPSGDAVQPSSPSAQASDAPEATPPASGPPALSSLTVSPAGIGTLAMNQPIPTEPTATAIAAWDPTFCVTDDRPEGDPTAGAWLSTYPTTAVPWAQQPVEAFSMYTEDRVQTAPLSGLIVWSPELSTATGIHPGSTRAELEAAYPSFASVTQKQLTDVYVVKDPDGIPGELWFEVANSSFGEISKLSTEVTDTVVWVDLWPTSDFAPYSLTETDTLGASCVP